MQHSDGRRHCRHGSGKSQHALCLVPLWGGNEESHEDGTHHLPLTIHNGSRLSIGSSAAGSSNVITVLKTGSGYIVSAIFGIALGSHFITNAKSATSLTLGANSSIRIGSYTGTNGNVTVMVPTAGNILVVALLGIVLNSECLRGSCGNACSSTLALHTTSRLWLEVLLNNRARVFASLIHRNSSIAVTGIVIKGAANS